MTIPFIEGHAVDALMGEPPIGSVIRHYASIYFHTVAGWVDPYGDNVNVNWEMDGEDGPVWDSFKLASDGSVPATVLIVLGKGHPDEC